MSVQQRYVVVLKFDEHVRWFAEVRVCDVENPAIFSTEYTITYDSWHEALDAAKIRIYEARKR